jgi:hypothetical protein
MEMKAVGKQAGKMSKEFLGWKEVSILIDDWSM